MDGSAHVAGPKPPFGSRGCVAAQHYDCRHSPALAVGLVLSSILADAAENTTGKMRQLNVAARAPAYDPCPVSSQTARVAS